MSVVVVSGVFFFVVNVGNLATAGLLLPVGNSQFASLAKLGSGGVPDEGK